MNNAKRLVCLVLAVLMLATFAASLTFAETQTLEEFGVTLDDLTVTAQNTGDGAFIVKLPDGRPRVPQLQVSSGTVTQAFLADGETAGTATAVTGGKTVTVTFEKDPSLGFVLQYDDYYTFTPSFTATSFTSSNTSVATVTSAGVVHIAGVSASPVTITATNGAQSETLTITKTIRAVLGVWMLTGQSNAAVNYYNKSEALAPKPGTCLHYGWQFAANQDTISYTLPSDFVPMTKADGTANVGSNEPSLASTLYDKLGEKVLLLNGAISGTGIGKFLPGCGDDVRTYTWAHTNEVFEGAEALWSANAFQNKYEIRVRSYFFLQGEAEVSSNWTVHYNGFAVNKNTNAFISRGVTYAASTHTWHSYMTEVLGFDYCFDILVGWRPVGMTTSTRTAQLKLAEDLDDYYIATRVNQTFSYPEGTLRYDNLHNSQIGRNYLGQSASGKAAAVYRGADCLEAATSAVAYFDKIGYADGSTIYVKPGDFYNYCTRAYPFTSDDPFNIVIEDGGSIVNYNGVNDFAIRKTAAPGSSCQMKIYSYTNSATPLATITIRVVGSGAGDFTARGNDVYSWSFQNGVATTTSGSIDLVDGGLGTGAFALSEDLTLDYGKYFSIEWRATDTPSGSMLASSSDAAATANSDGGKPDFMFIYYYNTTGWRVFRDTVYTDYFWKTWTGGTASGTHTYKIECSDHIYSFSIDGVVSETKELVQGHGSYAVGSTYSGKGYYSDQWNVHYLLGGVNESGTGGTHYGYNANVSYVKITVNNTARKITNINGYPYAASSGTGTATDPYVINARVAPDTVITPASFTATTPKGTLSLSEETFGGEDLESLTVTDTATVYAMITGSIAGNSKFYRVVFTASGTPDSFPDNMYPVENAVMVDTSAAAVNAATGRVLVKTVEGVSYNFVKGYDLFTDVDEAMDTLNDGGTLILSAGTYRGDYNITKSLKVIGAKAGIDPNVKGPAEQDAWTLSPDRSVTGEEAVITGDWILRDRCASFEIDGVTFTGSGSVRTNRTANDAPLNVTVSNSVITAITAGDAINVGENTNVQSRSITGTLLVKNLRAYGNSRRVMATAVDDVTVENSYFSGTNQIDYHRVPGVVDGKTDHTAAYTVKDSFFDAVAAGNMITLALTVNYCKSIASYQNVAVSFTGNVFRNSAGKGGATNGVLYLNSDTDNFTLNVSENLIYEGDGSTSTAAAAFVYGVGSNTAYDKELGDNYTFLKNRLISTEADLPYLFSTTATGAAAHSNVSISGNYFEKSGAVVGATVNDTVTQYTGTHPVSYSEYTYTSADLSTKNCAHSRTELVHTTATCQQEGYDGTLCSICGELLSGTVTPKADHIPGEWRTVLAATCTAEGKEERQCVVCGIKMDERTTQPKGHTPGSWTVSIPATCTAEGEKVIRCLDCKEVLQSETIPESGHNYRSRVTQAATCTAEGTTTYTCALCGDVYTEPIAKLAHQPGAWTTKKAAKCTEAGEEQRLCKLCGGVLSTREIAPTGHKAGAWTVVKKATTSAEGREEKHCLYCNILMDSRAIPKVTVDVTSIFSDLGNKDWYVKNGAITFAYTNGLLEGSNGKMDPNGTMTRAMFVAVLSRISGVKVNNKVSTPFSDVKSGQWYTGAVKWASENGIVTGANGKFMPNDPITREQICTILVTYSKFEKITLNPRIKAVTFKDAAKISKWAKSAVTTCQRAELVAGSNGYFNPQGKATRAEVATIFMYFYKYFK